MVNEYLSIVSVALVSSTNIAVPLELNLNANASCSPSRSHVFDAYAVSYTHLTLPTKRIV